MYNYSIFHSTVKFHTHSLKINSTNFWNAGSICFVILKTCKQQLVRETWLCACTIVFTQKYYFIVCKGQFERWERIINWVSKACLMCNYSFIFILFFVVNLKERDVYGGWNKSAFYFDLILLKYLNTWFIVK